MPRPSSRPLPAPSPLAEHWTLDPQTVFLNHGSFGATPRRVQERQRELQARMERNPVLFLDREGPELIAAARQALAELVGASARDLVSIGNATTAVNTVLRSFPIEAGDELLTTDHAYNACKNALDRVASERRASVKVVAIPIPCDGPDAIVEAILEAVTPSTVLALLDHVTSPTAIVLPIERLVSELRQRGVESVVDGAHALGMIPLQLDRWGAAAYTANAHKWLCAPKGAAFLHVRRDLQSAVRPLVISHGANKPLDDPGDLFQVEFGWTGTSDPTPFMSIPTALETLRSFDPEGMPGVMRRNHELAIHGRRILLERLRVRPACPESMLGSMASLLMDDAPPDGRVSFLQPDPLGQLLFERDSIEVTIFSWPAPPRRQVRISAQLYNSPAQYERLAEVLASSSL